MRYISIILLLALCLILLLFTGCKANIIKPETISGNLEKQEDINQSSNNSQSLSTTPIYEPVIEENTEDLNTVYPQKWATGAGTVDDPWAVDCINDAYTACPTGGTIYLKAGYYQLTGALNISKQINIIGEGRNETIIKTVGESNIWVAHDNCTLKGFTIDGDSQTEVKWIAAITVANCDYASLEDIEVKNAGYYGIDIYQVNNSSFQNIYAHDNYRHGLHPGSDTAGRNTHNVYRDIYAWNNGVSGFDDRGTSTTPEKTYNVYDNLQCWDNSGTGIDISNQNGITLTNSYASGNGSGGGWAFGIYLFEVEDSSISNCSVIYNAKKGIGLTGSNNINIDNCFLILNVEEGIYIEESSDGVNLANIIIKNNGTGVILDTCSNIRFTSCQSYDDRNVVLQEYGLILKGTNTDISLLNCKLTPNQFGEIYNPNGAEVTVVTEKILGKF